MQPARTFFARMDFVEMGSALRMPYAQLTLRAIPRILFVTFPRWIPTLIHAIRSELIAVMLSE